MSAVIQMTFVLTGALSGKTIALGKYKFVDGRLTIKGAPEEVTAHGKFIERNWRAYPLGHAALRQQEQGNGQRNLQTNPQHNPQPPLSGDLQPLGEGAEGGGEALTGASDADATQGETGILPQGAGQQAGLRDQVSERIYKAVMSLDPNDDKQWTSTGQPAMAAVEALFGHAGITRKDVEAAAPGWTREDARAMAQGE